MSTEVQTFIEIWIAVPESTTKTQWAEINRAVSYGQGVGIEVKITQVKQ
ncbi:endonuclease toxin domain-containing protein [Providencia sp. Me31A]